MKQLALIKFLSAATIVCAADVPITQDELVRRTQELYDAVVPGNQAPWKKHFADDCIFADEKGRIFDKPKLIADITPQPDHWEHGGTQLRRGRDRDDFRPKSESAISHH